MAQNEFITEDTVLTKYTGNDESVTVPDGITEIGEWAFSHHGKVKEVILPEGVTVIRHLAFEHCLRLRKVVLPNSLKEIGHHAFYNCPLLSDIRIPDGIQTLGASLFKNCASLADENGFIITGDILHQYFGENERICVPDGIREIAAGAFEFRRNLKSLVLPDTLKTIGVQAFMGCYALKNITLPHGVSYIGAYAFANCRSIRSLIIPETVQTLGSSLFQYDDNVEYIHLLSPHLDAYYDIGKTSLSPFLFAENVRTFAPNKTVAILGLAVETENGSFTISKEAEREMQAYLRRYRKKYYTYFEMYPSLLQYMVRHRLILPEDIPSLVDNTADTALKAALLSYQNENMTPKVCKRLTEKESRKTEQLFADLIDTNNE